jgi:predicted sugar kinase
MRAGSALDLLETPDGIILKPVESLARKGRFLVFTGEVPEGWDVVKAIEEEREAQDRKTSDIGLSHKPGRCVMEATAGI